MGEFPMRIAKAVDAVPGFLDTAVEFNALVHLVERVNEVRRELLDYSKGHPLF